MIILKKLGGIRLSALVALCAATLMLISLLLPYAVTPGGFNPQPAPGSEAEVEDVSSYSMLELTLHLKNELFVAPEQEMMGWIYVVLLSLTALCCLLAMLFPLMDRATPTALFALVAYGPFYLFSLDLTQRGWIGDSAQWLAKPVYVWGIGYYLFHVGLAIAVVGAVWLFVDRFREKRAPKAKEEHPAEEKETETV